MIRRSDRLRHILTAGLFFAAAVALQLILMKLGHGIQCPFRAVTGLRCPGCGVSHMAMHLVTGYPVRAFFDNPVVFCEMPVIAAVIARKEYRYYKTGRGVLTKGENVLIILCLAALLVFGVVRNIP